MDGAPLSGGSALGELLRRHRLAGGLSQEELGEQSGLSVRTICDIERGRTTRPHRKTVSMLAAAMEIKGSEQAEFLRAARLPGAGPVPAEPPAQREDPRPRGLPAPVSQFVGRVSELQALDELAEGGGPAVAIVSGAAGIGKTSLALHWAHRAAGDFPDGQLYLNLSGFDPSGQKLTPGEAIRILLDGLHVPPEQIPASLQAQSALYRSTLADKRALLVLDNARDAEQVTALLPGSPSCLTLITSRGQLAGLVAAQGARSLTLGQLSSAEARELLAGRLGADLISRQPAAVEEIISRCGRLPLALAIVAARAALGPAGLLGSLAAELDGRPGMLSALDVDGRSGSARAVFSWSYRELSDPAARMFRLLGLHPGPDIGIPAAASLAAVPVRRASELLEDLSRLHMVTEHAPRRYSLHDLMRAYAAELVHAAEPGPELGAARHRMLDYYLHAASAAARLVHPTARLSTPELARPEVVIEDFSGHQAAMAWFQAEHRVLLAVTVQASQPGLDSYAAELPAAIRDFLEYRGYWPDIVVSQKIALTAARRRGDLAGQARAHRGIAHARVLLGALEDAERHSRSAIGLCRRLGDRGGEGRAHLGISRIREQQRRYADALEHSRLALELFRSAADRAGEAAALINVGTFLTETGDYLAAADASRLGIDLHRRLGYPHGVAAGLDSLGCAYHRLGQHRKAIGCLRTASDLCADAGDRLNHAVVLSHLGDACIAAGSLPEAAAAWAGALEIFEKLNASAARQVRVKLSGLDRASSATAAPQPSAETPAGSGPAGPIASRRRPGNG